MNHEELISFSDLHIGQTLVINTGFWLFRLRIRTQDLDFDGSRLCIATTDGHNCRGDGTISGRLLPSRQYVSTREDVEARGLADNFSEEHLRAMVPTAALISGRYLAIQYTADSSNMSRSYLAESLYGHIQTAHVESTP